MHLVRYRQLEPEGEVGVGVLDGESIYRLTGPSLGSLLDLDIASLREVMEGALTGRPLPRNAARLLPPADSRMEIWAAGVSYLRSREARMEESATADIYQLVYEAQRPELFFKCAAWRAVTDGDPVGIRRDSALNVPEPELTVVVNSSGTIVGYGICDDVSSRSIEGDNPLYLPQAKVYAGSCALGAGIRPAWEIPAPDSLEIRMDVSRDGAVVWSGTSNTSAMRRQPQELVEYLFSEEQFPDGVVLSTGTGIVPEIDFSLQPGDVASITIEEVGRLTNEVVSGPDHFAWLADR